MAKLHIDIDFDHDAEKASIEMIAVGTPLDMLAALAAATANLTEKLIVASPTQYALRLAEDLKDSQIRAVADGALRAAKTLQEQAGGKP